MTKKPDEDSDDPVVSITQTMTDSPGSYQAAGNLTIKTVVRYSSTQVVEISTSPGSYNEMLNLDNVGTMIQADEWNHDQIGMVLLDAPPLMINKLTAGERYNDSGGLAIVFNPDNHPAFQLNMATISGTGTKYLFSRLGSPTHIVQVGERRFQVVLQSIRDKSNKKKRRTLIAYTFGISEL